jgi:hypothetical protein
MSTQDDANVSTQYNFLSLLARGCPEGLHFLVTLKKGEYFSTWAWDGKQLPPGAWYFYTGASDHKKLRQDVNTHAVRAIVIDDVGTKVDAKMIHATPTWILETSPGNFQWGFLLEEWCMDVPAADALVAALVEAKMQDKAVNRACRLFRIPGSINDKEGRDSFEAVLHHFDPLSVYTLESLAASLKIFPGPPKPRRVKPETPPAAGMPDPIFDWLLDHGYIIGPKNDAGWWPMLCPFPEEHTDGRLEAKYMHKADSDVGKCLPYCNHTHGQFGKEAEYAQRVIDWVLKQPAAPNKKEVVEDSVQEAFAKILREAASFREDPPPPVTVPTLEHNVQDHNLYDFVSLRASLGHIDVGMLPHIENTAEGKPKAIQPTSYENVEAGLRLLDVHPRLNLMTAKTSYILPERIEMHRFGNKSEREIADMVEAALTDVFGRARMKSEQKLKDCFARIANSIYWHPMRDWILAKKWDGKDRLELLAGSVTTTRPDLWRRYLRRWALQTIEATCGWTVRRESQKGMVLVLVGDQRIGKSRWLMSLAPGFGKIGKHLNLNGLGARDSKHEALQGGIVELGELDGTLRKSDIAALKAFITEETDEYRLPYAAIWLCRPRCTSFCGSVNDEKFLNDPTGSGRFLAVKVIGRPHVDHGVDMQQFWAQMYVAWEAGEQWYLTDEEEALRAAASDKFQAPDPVPEDILESLERRKDIDKYPIQVIIGPQHMLALCDLDRLHPKNLRSAGVVLARMLGPGRDLYKRGAPTKQDRWIIQATDQEVRQFKLHIAKPEVTNE